MKIKMLKTMRWAQDQPHLPQDIYSRGKEFSVGESNLTTERAKRMIELGIAEKITLKSKIMKKDNSIDDLVK